MFEKLLAIDIGTSSVKVIAARRGLKRIEIIHFSSRIIDPMSDSPASEISEAIEEIYSELEDDDYILLTNIPLSSVVLRNFTFPFSDVSKIAEILPMEAEETLPYDLDELELCFQMCSSSDESGDVLAAAVRKDEIVKFSEIFTKIGKNPAYLGIQSNSLFELLHPDESTYQNFIQLDIGHSQTTLNIVKNRKIIVSRLIPKGCSAIISQIASLLKIDYNEAFGKYENLHLDITSLENNLDSNFYKSLKITKKQLEVIFAYSVETFQYIHAQLDLTLQSLSSSHAKFEAERLYLTGGGALLPRISEFFGAITSIPVGNLPALSEFNTPGSQTRFAVCYGILALYKKRAQYIDFLSETNSKSHRSIDLSHYYPAMFFSAIAIVVLSITLLLNVVFSLQEKARSKETLEKHYQTLFKTKSKTEVDPISAAKKMQQKEQGKLTAILTVIPEKAKMIDLIYTISAQLPKEDGFVLSKISLSEKQVIIAGTVENINTLTTFMNKLKGISIFESVTDRTASTGTTSKFTIDIKFKKQVTSESGGK